MRARDDLLPRVAPFLERDAVEQIEIEHLTDEQAGRGGRDLGKSIGDIERLPFLRFEAIAFGQRLVPRGDDDQSLRIVGEPNRFVEARSGF